MVSSELRAGSILSPFYLERVMWERAISILTVLSAFAGAWIYIDSHYATAADVSQLAKEFRLQTYDLRKRQLKDKIFELEFKQNSRKLSDLEKAQLNSAKQELQEIVTHEAAVNSR